MVPSSPFLQVVLSDPLPAGSGRNLANRWFVQVANLDTLSHVAVAKAACVTNNRVSTGEIWIESCDRCVNGGPRGIREVIHAPTDNKTYARIVLSDRPLVKESSAGTELSIPNRLHEPERTSYLSTSPVAP